MRKEQKPPNIKLRYNIITTMIYIVGIILLIQLFNLQIVNGEEYRQTSNTRLTRQGTVEAARGSILDSSGNVLAGNKMGFSLELYKSKVDNSTLNNTILKIIQVLEANEDSYTDTFPIKYENSKFKFTISADELTSWKETYKIDENLAAEDCINIFKEKYSIEKEDKEEVRKIIAVRYRITTEGYSSTKSIKIAEDISRKSAVQFNEQNEDFAGINVMVEAIREYPNGSLAAHILGYIGKINEKELAVNADSGYEMNDYFREIWDRICIREIFKRYRWCKTNRYGS